MQFQVISLIALLSSIATAQTSVNGINTSDVQIGCGATVVLAGSTVTGSCTGSATATSAVQSGNSGIDNGNTGDASTTIGAASFTSPSLSTPTFSSLSITSPTFSSFPSITQTGNSGIRDGTTVVGGTAVTAASTTSPNAAPRQTAWGVIAGVGGAAAAMLL